MSSTRARRRSNRCLSRAQVLVAGGVLGLAAWTGATLAAQVGDRTAVDAAPPPSSWTIPPAPVRSPEESMRMMDLQPGFRIELVAAEPLVQDPIAFAFDERNGLWVLEWPSYNWPLRDLLPDIAAEPAPASRLVVLRDTTGDGRMDQRTVFAEMEWPRGIQLVNGGVLVFALPDVVFLRDTNGDDKADSREVVYDGLPIPVNPHTAPSSPSWTLDNWTYGLQVDERLRFVGTRRDAVPAGRLAGQWGMSHDDFGRLFFSYNQDHVRGTLVPASYATRNPHYTAAAGIDVRIAQDNEVWPHGITPGVNRRAQLHDDGRLRVFTANAAPAVYRGAHFPQEFHGNVFVGESAGRLIRRSVLAEKDGLITGRNGYDGREFLFSHDERFRPVYSATGPDGALYIADMYRGIIEGHIFLTTFLRDQVLDRGLHQPFHGMGRIYRIRHESRPLDVPPTVAAGDAAGWVPHLAHQNGHWRDTAQRALVQSGSHAVVPAVREMAVSHADPRARLHAFWTLEGLAAADAAFVRTVLRDRSPHLRIAALRVAEAHLSDSETRRAVLALADDGDLTVRRQLLYTLGAVSDDEATRTCWRLLRRDAAAPFVVDAFLSGLAGRERRTLDAVLHGGDWDADRPETRALLTALATAITNEGDARGIDDLLRLASDEGGQPPWRRLALLEGLAGSRRTELEPQPASLALLAMTREPALREKALQLVERFTPRAALAGQGAAQVDPATRAVVEQGRAAYAICAACHRQDGRGLPAMAPPLAGAAIVIGAPDALIDLVLHGRDENPSYPSMPPLGALPDDQLAAILTYVRQAWGNAAPPVTPQAVRARRNPPPQGFESLFNGKDLTGWRGRPGGGGVFSPYVEAAFTDAERREKQAAWDADRDLHWSVDAVNGEIVTDGQGVHLATANDYGNFELRLEWKLTQPGGVTGVYLRSYPQVQLWDPANPQAEKTGAFRGSGALWNNADGDPGKWPLVKADKPIGEWNTLRIRMIGERVWVWLNDQLTVEGQKLDNLFDRGQPLLPTGAIELQTHGSEVRFRSIFVREIPDSEAAAVKQAR